MDNWTERYINIYLFTYLSTFYIFIHANCNGMDKNYMESNIISRSKYFELPFL
jgi:hypothetical protein